MALSIDDLLKQPAEAAKRDAHDAASGAINPKISDAIRHAPAKQRTALRKLLQKLAELPEEEWSKPIAGPIMGGFPRTSIVGGIEEHTSHHRGALAVYQRLLYKVLEMPYA